MVVITGKVYHKTRHLPLRTPLFTTTYNSLLKKAKKNRSNSSSRPIKTLFYREICNKRTPLKDDGMNCSFFCFSTNLFIMFGQHFRTQTKRQAQISRLGQIFKVRFILVWLEHINFPKTRWIQCPSYIQSMTNKQLNLSFKPFQILLVMLIWTEL